MNRLCAGYFALINGFPPNMVTNQALTFVGLLFHLFIFQPNVSGRGNDDTSDEEQNDGRLHLVLIVLRLNVFTAERMRYVSSVLRLRGTVCGGNEPSRLK